jgi:hypothetical protein
MLGTQMLNAGILWNYFDYASFFGSDTFWGSAYA